MTLRQNTIIAALRLRCTQMGALVCVSAVSATAMNQAAFADTYQAGASKAHSQSKFKTYMQTHPKVRKAAIGAGVGTAAGAAVGMISGKGALRGAAIGAGTGATVGAISGSKTMKAHPYMKDMAEGTLGGAGLSLAMNKGHGKGKRVAEGAALGAVAGLGAGFLKKEFQ
jgi:hypothetical protein